MKFFQKIQGTRPAVIYGLGTLFLLFCTVEQDEARSESIGFSPQTTEYASFSKIKAPQCRGGGAFSAYYLESVLMGKEGGDSLFPRLHPMSSYRHGGVARWKPAVWRWLHWKCMVLSAYLPSATRERGTVPYPPASCIINVWPFQENYEGRIKHITSQEADTVYVSSRMLPVTQNITWFQKKHKGAPTLTCTVLAQIPLQKNLLVASSGEINGAYNRLIPLELRHVFPDIEIKSISLNKMNNSGTYDMESQSWSLNASLQNFSLQVSSSDRQSLRQEKTLLWYYPKHCLKMLNWNRISTERREKAEASSHIRPSIADGLHCHPHLSHSSNPESILEGYTIQEDYWGEEKTIKFDPIRLW